MRGLRVLLTLLLAAVIVSCGETGDESVDLFPVLSGDCVGYIDSDGELVIAATYQGGLDFSEGLAAVRMGDRWGYITPSGEVAIPGRYQVAGEFSEGLAPVRESFRWKYIDKQGQVRIVLPEETTTALQFSNGLAPIRKNDLWEYVRHDGTRVPGRRYRSADVYSEGLAAVASARPPHKFGYIDSSRAWVIPCRFDAGVRFSEGLAPVLQEPDGWGYIDRDGNWVIEPKYTVAGPFSEGVAAVNSGGTVAFPVGGSPVVIGGHWKYISRNDSTVVRVDSLGRGVAEEFRMGIARITTNGDYWYINRDGEVIWSNTLGN